MGSVFDSGQGFTGDSEPVPVDQGFDVIGGDSSRFGERRIRIPARHVPAFSVLFYWVRDRVGSVREAREFLGVGSGAYGDLLASRPLSASCGAKILRGYLELKALE